MTTNADLDALLARAVALEGVLEAKGDDPEYLELKGQVAELAETVDAVIASLDDLEEGGLEDEPELEVPAELDPDLADLDPDLGEKSWLPCPLHEDADRDEFKDGTATCTECGTSLVETKGLDFDDFEAAIEEAELKAVRDYIRDPDGEFASSGHADSAGGKAKLPADPDDYKVEGLDSVRAIMRNWSRIPLAARAKLKAKLEAAVAAHSEDGDHARLTALVGGLGDGDGKAEAGVGSAAAVAHGNADEWLAKHGKKADEDPLEVKGGLSEFELLLARRQRL